ncbi:MAG: MBL fold metallo-hydrolase, partial [Myxococcales bacterium]|nr:MBL fold metallo-hydrolase [Myxococcales bacterium]
MLKRTPPRLSRPWSRRWSFAGPLCALLWMLAAHGARASDDGDAAGLLDGVRWLGHSSIVLHHERTIYFDPYDLRDTPRDADLILITHPHYDHCSRRAVRRLLKPSTRILTVRDCAEKLDLGDRVVVVRAGERYEESGVAVETIPAYNPDGLDHPKARGWVGFVVRSGGHRYYDAGDTGLIPEMSDIQADVAFVPIDGRFTMNPYEAAEAATRAGAK